MVSNCQLSLRINLRNSNNKNVLLRERKRHTARRIASNPPAVLFWGGYPIPGWGEYPNPGWEGVPIPGGGYPIPGWGYPILGNCLSGIGVLPWQGTWDQSLRYPLERKWDQWKYYGMEKGTSPECGQTDTCENSIFPILRMQVVTNPIAL